MVDGLYDPYETRASVYEFATASTTCQLSKATEELISRIIWDGKVRLWQAGLGWCGIPLQGWEQGSLFVIDGNAAPNPFRGSGRLDSAFLMAVSEQNGNKPNYLGNQGRLIQDMASIWLTDQYRLIDIGSQGGSLRLGSFRPESPYYAAYGVKNGELQDNQRRGKPRWTPVTAPGRV